MPEKRPLRLPSWVVLTSVVVGVLIMVPASMLVYMRSGYNDNGAMQVLGLMLVPMLPFVVVSLWKGLDMPDEGPPLFRDTSRQLSVGETAPPPKERLTTEGLGLIAAGTVGGGGLLLAYFLEAMPVFYAALAAALAGLGLAAYAHIRRANREDED